MNGPILLPEEHGDGDEKSTGSRRRLSVAPDEATLRTVEEARTLKGVAPDGGVHGYWSTNKGQPTDKLTLKHPDHRSVDTIPYIGNESGTVVSLREALKIRARRTAGMGAAHKPTHASTVKPVAQTFVTPESEVPKVTLKDRFNELENHEKGDIEALFDSRTDSAEDKHEYEGHLNMHFASLSKLRYFRNVMEKLLAAGTLVNVIAQEEDEWDADKKGAPYLITSYEFQNPKADKEGEKKVTPDVIVYLESQDKKEHMAISLRELFRWNEIN